MLLAGQQEKELQTALRSTRILALAMCCGGPASYIAVYGLTVLDGRWERFLQGLGSIPWQQPVVPALLAVSAMTLAGVFALPGLLGRVRSAQASQPPLAVLRARSIISYALLEAVAIYGLVLGFIVGPAAASLSLVLMLAPPVLGLTLMPSEPVWRDFCGRAPHA
jgi:F0F1-type ATP synthase membrane subunit c/vacuolar-type H+-ATPase subunit K